MNKTELEEAIKNGESVWEYRNYEIREINLKTMYPEMLNEYQLSYIVENNENATMYFTSIEDLYKTKAEAEHYLNHANVKRVEQLPFVTWEEFDNGDRFIRFTGKNKENCKLEGYQSDDKQTGFIDIVVDGTGLENYFYYNEENFYKAYDKCVKLFKGEEI